MNLDLKVGEWKWWWDKGKGADTWKVRNFLLKQFPHYKSINHHDCLFHKGAQHLNQQEVILTTCVSINQSSWSSIFAKVQSSWPLVLPRDLCSHYLLSPCPPLVLQVHILPHRHLYSIKMSVVVVKLLVYQIKPNVHTLRYFGYAHIWDGSFRPTSHCKRYKLENWQPSSNLQLKTTHKCLHQRKPGFIPGWASALQWVSCW